MHEVVVDCFCFELRRMIPGIILVPEGQTKPWALCGPPSTSLPQDPTPHPQLREGSGSQACQGACARTCHWENNWPRQRCMLRCHFHPQSAPGPGGWQPLSHSAPPPPARQKTRRMCQNVALPTLGGVAFCIQCNMGFLSFSKCPRKGSHTHPLAAVVDVVATARAMALDPVVGAD